MKMKYGAPLTFGLMAVAVGITCTTIGHYADHWAAGYLVAGIFALITAAAALAIFED